MAGKELYTAHAHVDGGRTDGHGRSDDGLLEVDLRQPGSEEENDGTNPEQLFAVGYGACFDGAVGAVARRQRIDPGKLSIDSAVTLLTGEDR
jgi:lipoyl-dependent peroxiredoxin